MKYVNVTFRVRKEKAAAFEAMLGQAFQAMRSDPGIVSLQLLRSQANPQTYIARETFRDQAAWDEHRRQSDDKDAVAVMMAMLEGPPDVDFLDAIDT